MKKKIQEGLGHPLITGSLTIVIGSFAANIFNFFFNLFMVRSFLPSEYGVLASLVSLMTIFSIPSGAFVPTIVRFGASYLAKNELDKVRGLFFKVGKICLLLGIISFFIFLIFSTKIGTFFKINDSFLILIVGFTVVLSFVGVVNSGLIQAKLNFKFITLSNFICTISKFITGVLLVYLGFGIKGAILAFLISSLIPYIISFIPLKFLFEKGIKMPKINNMELFSFGAPAAVAMFGLTSFITTDILLVKHFFDSQQAGVYAGASLIGRIIFFISAPITTVMFPMIVQKHEKKENYHNTFKLAMMMVLIPSICITVFYFLFSDFAINFFSKKEYISGSYLLGPFGIYIAIYSILFIITNFYVSIKKTFVFIPIILGAFLQVFLIWFFHSTLLEIIIISTLIEGLLVFILLLYYMKLYGKEKYK